MSYLFSEGVWLPQERIKACEEITPESLRSKAVEIIKSYHKVSAYSHGDLPSDVALTAQDLLVNKLSSTDTEVDNTNNEENIFRARIIPIGHTVLALPGFNPEDPNSALLTHIQVMFY